MEDIRLVPFETLEKDYYLDGNEAWGSGGENGDSDSSDDELRATLSKLAGVRCKGVAPQKKDEFESDMDDELDDSFVAHASKVVFSSSAIPGNTDEKCEKKITSNVCDSILGRASDADDLMDHDGDVVSECKPKIEFKKANTSALKKNDGVEGRAKKSVTISEQTHTIENNSTADESAYENSNGSFDDKDNILRKAADKARKAAEEEVDFYDPEEDDDNERWVREHRERLRIIKRKRTNTADKSEGDEKKDETDAVLSCPACMTLLTRDCQQHELYHHQWRAIFVENCKVMNGETVFMPESNRKGRKALKFTYATQPGSLVNTQDSCQIPKEDLFHPVQCSICSTAVGVFDHEEVFHFFNVLSGYA